MLYTPEGGHGAGQARGGRPRLDQLDQTEAPNRGEQAMTRARPAEEWRQEAKRMRSGRNKARFAAETWQRETERLQREVAQLQQTVEGLQHELRANLTRLKQFLRED
jgi:predicted RNase H-like nuclease (RuvC/YqgF family)